jgi:hypothetical protein
VSSHAVAAPEWPPEFPARVKCQVLHQAAMSPSRAAQAHQPQEIGDRELSSHPVAAQEWPPQLTTRVGCQLLQEQGARTALQAVSGYHPANQTID